MSPARHDRNGRVRNREGHKTDKKHNCIKYTNRIKSGRYKTVVEQRQGEERGVCSKKMGSQ